jgi:small subunit ribosomal protein S1
MPTETSSKSLSPLGQLIKNELSNIGSPREGSVIEAELISKSSRRVFFDLGKVGTGIVYGTELSNAREIVKNLKIGDRVPAKIDNFDGEDGYVEISLAEAGKQRLWQQIQELQESGEIVKVKILGSNAGGFTTELLGLKAFLPFSQLSSDHYSRESAGDVEKANEEMKKLIGEELNVKVINVNPRSNKLILSEREIVSANVKELLAKYQVSQTVDCIVSGIADFGIFVKFVDDPQIEGLIHISEIDHRLIDNPKEIVKIGETLQVKIIDIKDGQVFLSLKALKTDPWEKIEDRYKVGEEVSGQLYKFNPFGAVMTLDRDIQGMIHVSEFGGLDEMRKAILPNETYTFIIDSLKPQEKRLILKIKK